MFDVLNKLQGMVPDFHGMDYRFNTIDKLNRNCLKIT
jgi:hypothetical protein